MENLNDKPTTDLISIQKDLEMTHESVKLELLRKLDELDKIELKYARIAEILNERIRR